MSSPLNVHPKVRRESSRILWTPVALRRKIGVGRFREGSRTPPTASAGAFLVESDDLVANVARRTNAPRRLMTRAGSAASRLSEALNMTSRRFHTLSLALIALVFATHTGQAVAQAPGPGQGWAGYAPGYAWGSATGPVAYTAAGAPLYFQPGQGWVGYQPGRGWVAYNPGASWAYVSPGAGSVPVVTSPPVQPRSTFYGMRRPGVPSSYREYGSGRTVPLHKPWLPGSL
jgi:hypothetical protein